MLETIPDPSRSFTAETGQGIAPYDLCDFTAPVLGAVSFDDVRSAGVLGFDDEIAAPGDPSYIDDYGYLSRGVRCFWFLEEGGFGLRMDPGNWYFDWALSQPDSVPGERNGRSIVTNENEIVVLLPTDGYGGWTTFAISYDTRQDQSLEGQAAIREQLLDLFIGAVRFAPPTEPIVATPDWFVCSRPDAFGSRALTLEGAGDAVNIGPAGEYISVTYLDGGMRCRTNAEEWSATVSFVWDDEAWASTSSLIPPLGVQRAPIGDGRIEQLAGFEVVVAKLDPDHPSVVRIDIVLPEGRLNVEVHSREVHRGEMERAALAIAKGVLAGRPAS